MVETADTGFVLGTGLLVWVAAVTAVDGWGEPAIAFWGAVLTLGVAGAFLAAEAVELPS
ncbi:hypothetical protein [Halolamina rubra]|uniref:hypothetical protein n=1 Tax=Halolamina rubra TaxID=1380430 RepID=UPI0012ABA799|nr:hypothetical protein [Halolamina rubra]